MMLESGSNKVDIASRLRVARTAGGLTQSQAADKLGLSRTTLVAIEQGDRQVRPAELIALANLYGTSVNALTRPTADGPAQESIAPAPSRLAVLVAEAVTTGLVSEGQASEMLCITRLQLRRLVDDINADGCSTWRAGP